MFWLPEVRRAARLTGPPPFAISVVEDGQPVKQRTYHVVARMGDNHNLGVFNNSVYSVERALLERYALCEVEKGVYLPALPTTYKEWQAPGLLQFREQVVDEVRQTATVLTLREVVKCYTGAKRRIYENALRSLMRTNLNKSDAKLKPFTKFEKQDLSKAPRIINPRSPRYNLVLGKYLKKAEKSYFRAINNAWGGHTAHTVIKGMNQKDAAEVLRSKWDRFKRPVALGLDARKYDMHVRIPGLDYEHSFYNLVFMVRELAELLLCQLRNYGVAYCPDGKVGFTVDGTRCSGDLNTALGNCIIMCALIWNLCEEIGVDAELANNGDDCVLFLEEDDLDRVIDAIPGYFVRFGFRMTVEDAVYDFEKLEFCQSQPVKLASGWCMVRNVRTCLKKDPMCLIPIQNDRVWRKWLGAVGECGLASVPGCPVLQSFYGAFVRSGKTASRKFKQHIFRNTGVLERVFVGKSEITDEARASFYAAFGIMPDYQLALEHYYDKMEIESWDGEVRVGVVENAPPAFLRYL